MPIAYAKIIVKAGDGGHGIIALRQAQDKLGSFFPTSPKPQATSLNNLSSPIF